MTKSKFFVPSLAFITDASLAYYTYYVITKSKEIHKIATSIQFDFYQMFLQTLIFVLITFLFIHLVIYIFFYRQKNYAKKYVRFYLVAAVLSLAASLLFSFDIYLLIATISYAFCFKSLKTAEL